MRKILFFTIVFGAYVSSYADNQFVMRITLSGFPSDLTTIEACAEDSKHPISATHCGNPQVNGVSTMERDIPPAPNSVLQPGFRITQPLYPTFNLVDTTCLKFFTYYPVITGGTNGYEVVVPQKTAIPNFSSITFTANLNYISSDSSSILLGLTNCSYVSEGN